MPIIGSDGGFQADNRGGIIDELGNTIVSANTEFGASPLGVAALTQAQYGIPNGTFDLTPPDPTSPLVANENDLPYWTVEDLSDGQITITPTYSSTNWSMRVAFGTALSGSTYTLTTRQSVISDTNLSVKERVFSRLQRFGTPGASSQWSLTLKARQYNAEGTRLSTTTLGSTTETDLSTTQFTGELTISATAAYVEFEFEMTATANITGSTYFDIMNLLIGTRSILQPSSGRVYVTFNSSGSLTVPTGVRLMDIIAIGAGGGGASGQLQTSTTETAGTAFGGRGGGPGSYVYATNFRVDAGKVLTVTIGAGGLGGTANHYEKAAGVSGSNQTLASVVGSNGGETRVNYDGLNYMVIASGGAGASATAPGAAGTLNVRQRSFFYTTVGGSAGATTTAGWAVGPGEDSSNYFLPENSLFDDWFPGIAGEDAYVGATHSGTQYFVSNGGASNQDGFCVGGSMGGSAITTTTTGGGTTSISVSTGGQASYGGAGGGGAAVARINTTGLDVTMFAGAGAWPQSKGSGGGGGGAVRIKSSSSGNYTSAEIYLDSGAGGDGKDGYVVLSYVTPGEQ